MGAYEFHRRFGDANGDGGIGLADLFVVIAAWGPCPAPPDHCPGDVDGDVQVGVNDLSFVLVTWD